MVAKEGRVTLASHHKNSTYMGSLKLAIVRCYYLLYMNHSSNQHKSWKYSCNKLLKDKLKQDTC